MFDLPNTKRVKRSKLFSSFSSSEAEDEIEQLTSNATSKDAASGGSKRSQVKFQSNIESDATVATKQATDSTGVNIDYGFSYEWVDKTQPPESANITAGDLQTESASNRSIPSDTTQQRVESKAEQQEQSYAFNLFAAPKSKPRPAIPSSTSPAHQPQPDLGLQSQPEPARITIRSPTPPPPPNTTIPSLLTTRPAHHYFTGSLPTDTQTQLKRQYTSAAITSATLTTLSQTSWPGTHLAWRVIHVPAHKLVDRTLSTITASSSGCYPPPPSLSSRTTQTRDTGRASNRTRPSKKRRIQRRKLVVARDAAKIASVRDEVAEREKRTRRNREKKVKRKIREKAKKAVDADGVDADVDFNAGDADLVMG